MKDGEEHGEMAPSGHDVPIDMDTEQLYLLA